MALASICLVTASTLLAQDITIKDPGEYNAYQNATTQTDPAAESTALENFLQTYPQSVVKASVLDMLVDIYYQKLKNPDKTVTATTRLLQIDPNNLKAILYSVVVKKSQCAQKADPQTCDDAAALAQKGLTVPKPAAQADADWKKLTDAAYPIFHSAIATDDAVSKKDFKAAEAEYSAELMLYSEPQSETSGLSDTLLLAQAYVQPGAGHDLIKAIWFFARVWDFAPASYKPSIEKSLESAYKSYHGGLDGLDDIKAQAQASIFPPGTYVPKPAPTPAERIHALLADPTTNLNTWALADKETVLAIGTKEDQDKLWALLKDKETPVPGVVIEASTTVIKMAVTDDAKTAKVPDFIVNLKEPLKDADVPAVGFEYKLQPAAELNGTYDNYTQIPGTATTTQTAQIVLRDGFVQPEKKKAPVHKPTPAHHAAH
jgi:hypothetical protein